MSATNRVANRIMLAFLGLVALAAGAWMLLRAFPQGLPALGLPPVALPAVPELTAMVLWVIVAGAALVLIVAIVWIATRGGGRLGKVVSDAADTELAGGLEIETGVANDVIALSLSRCPDILSSSVTAYRVHRAPALLVTVSARAGADLERLRDDVAAAVQQLDVLLERRIPVLLHVTSGVRASFAREHRVA